MKKFILMLMSSLSITSYAQINNTGELKVQADIQSGCLIQMNNIVIGDISGIVNDVNIPSAVYAKCTKGTVFTVKTPVAQSIQSPLNPESYFSYIYPMYHTTDPDHEFVGYRFLIQDQPYRVGTTHHFGDGTTNDRNVRTSYIQSVGTGNLETYPIDFRYWVYTHLKVGTYAGNQTFTLEY